MAMRDEIESMLAANCGPEEIVSAMSVAGHHPTSLRKVLRECGLTVSVPETRERHTKPPRNRLNEGGQGKCEDLSDDALRRIDLFLIAQGRTRRQIAVEWPTVDAAWIDATLDALCKPHRLKYGETLAAVLALDADGRYMKCRSEKVEMPPRSSVGRAGVAVGWQKRGGRLAMAGEMS